MATTARGENAELVRSLGADVVVDYTKDDFAEVLAGYVSGTRVRPVRRH